MSFVSHDRRQEVDRYDYKCGRRLFHSPAPTPRIPTGGLNLVTKIDKAVVAFILAAAGVLGSQPVSGGEIDMKTVITAVIIGLIAALGVWAAPNKPATP